MQFGFCTGFATNPLFSLDLGLVRRILQAGYDYPDFPLTGLWSADERQLSELFALLEGRKCVTACNFFPKSVRLIGSEMKPERIKAYLEDVLPILGRLGCDSIVLGSAGARNIPSGMEKAQADEAFACVLDRYVLPACAGKVTVLLEPLNHAECNYLNTLKEGMAFVRALDNPSFLLMADLYHMCENGEDVDDLRSALPLIHHVHLAEKGRRLPERAFSDYLEKGIGILKKSGYQGTISYETNDGELSAALALLSATWQA